MSEYLKNLSEAVAAMHSCHCEHVATSKVIEYFQNEKVFEGDVETYSLTNHAKASQAFAWAFLDNNETRYIAVLNIPPINDPSDAVRAAIASGQF